jgi:uncharacterized membrane protein (DUF2068 family)
MFEPGLVRLRYYERSPLNRLMLVDVPSPRIAHPSGIIRGSDPAHKRGLRTVATIEFLKGLLGVALAIGLLMLRHKDLWDVAEHTLEFLHVDPDLHFAQLFLDFADQVTVGQLTTLATLAFAYSGVRFFEAYGLWKTRIWGEWLAIFSGLVYLPFEIRALVLRSTPFRWGALVINLALVGYVAYVRASEIYRLRKERKRGLDELTKRLSTQSNERWSRSG